MGAIVLVDPGAGPRAGGRRYALPLLLVAGWAGLFAYSAAYLTEDMPFRSPPADPQPDAAPSRVVVLDAPAGPGSDLKVAVDGAGKAAPRSAAAVPSGTAAAPSHPARPVIAAAVPDYVGVWGPTAVACGVRSRRRGYLPATIAPDHARAGRTLCSFRDNRRVAGGWVMAAECSDRGRHWTSQVRLLVDGERLTWVSSRGTSTYVRCARQAG